MFPVSGLLFFYSVLLLLLSLSMGARMIKAWDAHLWVEGLTSFTLAAVAFTASALLLGASGLIG